MKNNSIVLFFVAVLFIFGFMTLPKLKKNEFPDVTIRQGVVAVVYPGATAQEVEERVAQPTEQYLFTFADVNKKKTYSYSRDGMLYVFVTLNNDVKDAKMTWSRIRQGLELFKTTSLPQGVLATIVIDDFGNASSLLLAIESDQRSSRELSDYTDKLASRLRCIETMGNIKVIGEEREEIAIYMDPALLTQYAVTASTISAELALHSLRTITGKADNEDGTAVIHVKVPYDNVYDLLEMIVFSDPVTGQVVKLRDVARIERHYQEASSYIQYTDTLVDNNRCMMLSMEMRSGYNVVQFGKEVDEVIESFLKTTPPDIRVHRITDQPVVVNRSVFSFLKDLVAAIIIVILVMLTLFPMRTALVSSTSVPVCIAAAWAAMYLLGMELNTVTLAALIVVLGMVVDDSVVVIDGYIDYVNDGYSRWYSASVSTRHLMSSMIVATCAITCIFFPMLPIMDGTNLGDFIKLFPWAVFITLAFSFLYAIWVIPYMSVRMIGPSDPNKLSRIEKMQGKFFVWLQGGYKKLLDICFRHKIGTIVLAVAFVGIGIFLFTTLKIQLLPKAERDSFAVEIHLAQGSSIEETAAVTDSLTKLLKQDKRVASVTSFIGMASPRFHITYAPQLASSAYAQLIVNTVSENATKELIDEYAQQYENIFPLAQIRFKQMDYNQVVSPIEYYIMGEEYADMEPVRDSLIAFMKQNENLFFVYSDYDETEEIIEVELIDEEAYQLGVTQAVLSAYLSTALSGNDMLSIWEGDYRLPTAIYTEGVHDIDFESIGDMLVPTSRPGTWVPLRQVARLKPHFIHSNMTHRNGRRCITVSADVMSCSGELWEFQKINKYIETLDIPEDVTVEPGGSQLTTNETMPSLINAIIAALAVMFIILVFHYHKIGISVLSISVSILCVFGSTFGLWLFGLDMSVTAILGVISLIGIIVRNAVIMYDYANELVEKEHLTPGDAAYHAGMRRMRPIFLTSVAAALGVVPMIIARTLLWEPMGVVICFGTLITFPLVVTVLPVAYSLAFDKGKKNPVKKNNENKD